MISLKSFVEAIHDAVISASNSLMDKNEDLLNKYFEESESTTGESSGEKGNLKPKNVVLEYPTLDEDGVVKKTEVHVPLITMVPLNMSQIEKATFTADFELSLVDDELQLNFPSRRVDTKAPKGSSTIEVSNGKLEIIVSPQEPSEGLKMVVEAYEAALKRQI